MDNSLEFLNTSYSTSESFNFNLYNALKNINDLTVNNYSYFFLGKKDLYTALVFFREKLIKDHPYYKAANLDDMLEVAGMIKTKKLDLEMGLNYACVPIDTSNELHVKSFYTWLGNHKKEVENKHVDLPDGIKFDKQDPQSLYDAENYVKICMAYRWLHYKYPEYFPHIEETIANVKLANKYIEKENVDALILACTELPLAIKPEDVNVPIVNTTQVHINAIYQYAIR